MSVKNITWGKMKQLFQKCDDSAPVTLEFLNSFTDFREEYIKCVESRYQEFYDAGYRAKYEADEGEISPVTMNGVKEYLKKVNTLNNEMKNILFDFGYLLSDAPYRGWSGEALSNMSKVSELLDKNAKEIDFILKETLSEDYKKGEH